MADVLDCGLEVSNFEPHSRYYVHFSEEYPLEKY